MGTHVLNGAFYSLPYDVLNDFAPISPLVTVPYVLFARKTMPAKDLNELIAWLKANPNKASAGITSVGYRLLAAFFQKETGTQFALVPYRGGAPAMQDLVAGQIDLLFGTPDQLPLMRAGSIKAYAVTSDTRLALAPDIPTFAEMGLPALSYSAWFGLFAPKGTPKDIIGKLNAAAVEALADPAVRSRLVDLGIRDFSARATDTGGARRACEGRCREMVADHQGVRDQGGVNGKTPVRVVQSLRLQSVTGPNVGLRVTSGGLGPTLRRQVDPRQRTPPAARVASGSGQNPPPALQKKIVDGALRQGREARLLTRTPGKRGT